ncbi:DUF3551 domain-containing protein [Rhodoplanes serenus]|uniref:DUF3551 domain-containing protein n=1 Tax=Rhodoplanes serenus TaxID=200615 RepID=A0A9X4XPL0_9BRAD|nr:DUF3551 domain-containing protein [Rhodoplanes serenus]MTW19030.1 DUF3551 domain-containing protein [Rhodoplanes serenus]
MRPMLLLRPILLSALAAATVLVVGAAPAAAQGTPVYPWCAQYGTRGGATNCYFSNLWQCQQAISGNGGYCYENPFYRGAGAPPPGERRRLRRGDG